MKSIFKIGFILLLILFIIALIYLNIKKYSINQSRTIVLETSVIEENIEDMKVNVVYNVTSLNVTATKRIPQFTQNNTKGYAHSKDVSEFNEIIKSEDVEIINENNEDENIIKNPELVSMEITDYRLEENRVTLTITDNNEVPYNLNDRYKIEKKNVDSWEELKRINPETMLLIKKNYTLDENNQYDFIIHWINDYGELDLGVYRIVKEFEEDTFYSNEFEIK